MQKKSWSAVLILFQHTVSEETSIRHLSESCCTPNLIVSLLHVYSRPRGSGALQQALNIFLPSLPVLTIFSTTDMSGPWNPWCNLATMKVLPCEFPVQCQTTSYGMMSAMSQGHIHVADSRKAPEVPPAKRSHCRVGADWRCPKQSLWVHPPTVSAHQTPQADLGRQRIHREAWQDWSQTS